MKVVILCGGQGTRLREESEFRPKPLVDIGGRQILWHIMKSFAHYGMRDFVLCLGYKGQMIKEYFLNYEAMNNDCTIQLGSRHSLAFHGAHEEQEFQVTLADTGLDALTGARIKKIEKYLGNDETFMVTYGDGVGDIDIGKLLAFHRAHGKLATVTTVRPSSRFGILELGNNDQVMSFAEKPQTDGSASAGFFIFQPEVLDYLDDRDDCALEGEPLKRLAQDGQLMAYRHDGFFFGMDTYREYLHLNEMWKSDNAPWAVWKQSPKKVATAALQKINQKRKLSPVT